MKMIKSISGQCLVDSDSMNRELHWHVHIAGILSVMVALGNVI